MASFYFDAVLKRHGCTSLLVKKIGLPGAGYTPKMTTPRYGRNRPRLMLAWTSEGPTMHNIHIYPILIRYHCHLNYISFCLSPRFSNKPIKFILPKLNLNPSTKVLLKVYESRTERYWLVFESNQVTLKGVTKVKFKYESTRKCY
jgi:hypothetical protein